MKTNVYEQNIVIDLEFTTIPKGHRKGGLRNEVIEIGAVRCDASGHVVDEFHQLVKPELAPHIAPRIVDLTHITDADVADAPSFAEALANLGAWIGCDRTTRLVAWSENDKKQIVTEATIKGAALPCCMTRWLDLQKVFPRYFDVGMRGKDMALTKAMGWCGVQPDGKSKHRALYDAQCTADLFRILVTGEYREYHAALAAAMPARRTQPEQQSQGFGVMASALAGLYAQMMATQTASAVA